MSSTSNTNGYRALIVPDERLRPEYESDSDMTPVTQYGPRPGQAQGDSAAVLSMSGTQDTTTYSVYATRGGFGVDAGWAWSTGGSDPYKGCNYPNLVESIWHVGGDPATDTLGPGCACTTDSGRVVFCWVKKNTSAGTSDVVVTFTDDGVTWTGADGSYVVLSDDESSDYFVGYNVDDVDSLCCRWDSVRSKIQLWIRVTDPSDDVRQFVLFESSDEGETWDLTQTNVLLEPTDTGTTYRRPVVGAVNGVTVLLVPQDNGTTYSVTQHVSYDEGRTFRKIGSGTWAYKYLQLLEMPNQLLLAAVGKTSLSVFVLVMSTGYTPVVDTTPDSVDALPDDYAYIALSYIHGLAYLHAASDTEETLVVVASATGQSDDWHSIGHEPGGFGEASYNVNITGLSSTRAFGGVALFLRWNGSGVDADVKEPHLCYMMGGWDQVTLPPTSPTTGGPQRVGFGPTNDSVDTFWDVDAGQYFPALLPGDMSSTWTALSTGSQSIPALTDGNPPYLLIFGSTTRYYTATYAQDFGKGVLLHFGLACSSSSDLVNAVLVNISNGVDKQYAVIVRLGRADGVLLVDSTTPTSTATAYSTFTVARAFLLAVREVDGVGVARLYSRTWTADLGYGDWEEAASLELDAATSSVDPDSYVSWGNISFPAGSSTYNHHWYFMQFRAASGQRAIHDLATTWVSPTQLGGAPASTYPDAVENGLYAAFSGGALRTDDSWTVAPLYDYPLSHLYPHLYPSPRDEWRSTGDNVATERFVWAFGNGSSPEGFGAAEWGCAVIGANFPSWKLQGYTNAGSWDTLIDASVNDEFLQLPYRLAMGSSNVGAYVTVDTGGTGSAARYIHENELVGATVRFRNVPTVFNTYARVSRNTSGFWGTSVGKKPVLFLENLSLDYLEETGTLDIWPQNSVGVSRALGSTEYNKIRFIVGQSNTVDNQYRIGKLIIGPVYVFGRQYSKGRVLTRTSNTLVNYTTSGASNSVVLGPTRRTVEFGWFEGVDQQDVYGASDSAEPDYVITGDEEDFDYVSAARNDLPTNLDGLYVRLSGGNLPVVYVPNLPYDDTEDQWVSTDGRSVNGFVYGRVQGDVKVTTVLGTEQASEVAQVAAIKIVEEV